MSMTTVVNRRALAGAALLSASMGMFSQDAGAATITNGFTFAVASGCVGGVGAATTGTHYHSNTGGSFGNPAGLAEVGEYGGNTCEEVRGLSEYNLSGLASGSAFVTFEVYQSGGLFSGSNNFPFNGSVAITAYQGDNTESTSDFQAPSVGAVGAFGTAGLVVGNTLSFDITSVFSSAISGGWSSLGIRLAAISDPGGGAWVFNNFRLTSESLCTPGAPCGPRPVPEPGTLALLGLGLAGLGLTRRRKTA